MRASAATTTPRSMSGGVGEDGEVRDLAQRTDGVEGGDEPPQAALVTHSARNEEQQAMFYFGRRLVEWQGSDRLMEVSR